MYIGSAQAELSSAGLEDNAGGCVKGLKLLSDLEGAVWGTIVNYY